MPATNRAAFLADCLGSIFGQTLAPWEVIVSQDGDDRSVAAVAREFGVRHVQNVQPLGQLRNRQQALGLACGELVAMLDDDDRWEPTFLARTTAALHAHPQCGFASTDHWLIDENGSILADATELASRRFGRTEMEDVMYGDVLERTIQTMPFALGVSIFRRSVLEQVGGIPDFAGTTPDFALMLRLGGHGVACAYVSERLGSYRIHQGQQTAIGRVENAASRAGTLRNSVGDCDPALRAALARGFRDATLEHAIALAHEGRRREAVAVLGGIGSLGLGRARWRRAAVLLVLMLTRRSRAPSGTP